MSLHRADSIQAEQLLYLLARCRLNPAQVEWMEQALVDLKEPERFEELATKTFVAPIAYFHLSRSKGQHEQPEMMAKLRARRMETAKNYLFLKSEANLFSSNILEPAGVTHVFFKGTAFADQFYEQPSMRHARDIDVLIARQHLASVVERGLAHGYSLCEVEAEMTTAERAFYLEETEVFPLQSPNGALIEVHCQVDSSGVLFSTEEILLQSEACKGSNFRRKMPGWLHLIYLCKHHSRHRWSHLHWLADLDAFLTRPESDMGRTKIEARRLRLWQCVEPCLRFREASGRPEVVASILDGTSNEPPEVNELVRASIENLGRPSRDLTCGSGKLLLPDLIYGWQMNAALRVQYFKWRFLYIFTPRLDDYRSSRLGRRIPAFLPIVRFTRVLRRRLVSLWNV